MKWEVHGIKKYHGKSGVQETSQNVRKMRASEEHIQPGCIIRIKQEPAKPKRHGLFLNSEHTIQRPPTGRINTLMAVWIKGRNDKLIELPFYLWNTTPKINESKFIKKVKRKRLK